MPKRLAIITTHPIQYYAPVFRLLHERGKIEIKVFYTWGKIEFARYDPGFGQAISWDIPLTEGYPLHWEPNIARDPGSHHFNGIDNPGLIASIRAFNPNAILVVGWSYRSHLQVMRVFKGSVPVFFRGDSTLLDRVPFPKNLLRALSLRWVYRHIDHAFFVGELNRCYFKKHGVKEARLSYATHAVDNARFGEDRSKEALAIRHRLGIDDADFMLLFAGKLEPKKDPFTLLKAFRKLNRPNVHLVFAGSGKLEEALKKAVSGQQSEIGNQPSVMSHKPAATSKNIHFLPFQNQSQMPALYQACDVFCLPSKGPAETWGLAVNEAMAAGKAVIVSNKTGCHPDLVPEGKNGYVFPAGDVDMLTQNLVAVTAGKEKVYKMGIESRRIIASKDFAHIAAAIEEQTLLF